MAEDLRIQISAETKELKKALKQSEKDVVSFGKEVTKGSGSLNKLGKSTANAVPSVQEFSRVIQDAPFGIQGVANNITQLTAQFGNLSKNAGGTKAALKAMLGTLSGPAGILLAVSAVTSLLVSFGDKLKFSADQTGRLADATKKFLGEARAEISTLETLLSIARDENLSKKARLNAIAELQKKYPAYLSNLSIEKINTDEVKNSVDALSKSLIRAAKLKGLQSIIDEESAEIAGDVLKLELERQKLQKKIASGTDAERAGNEFVFVRQRIEEINKELKELEGNSKNALAPFLELERQILSEDLEQKVTPSVTVDPKVKLDKAKFAKDIKRVVSESIDVISTDGTFNNISLGTDDASISAGIESDLNKIAIARGQFLANQLAFEEAYKASLARINEETNLKTSLVTSAFTALGQNIANALGQTQGIFGAFVGTIIQESLKLVQQLIISSIKGAAATKAAAAGQIAAAQGAASALAVQAAAATAAASGPGAAFILPGLIAGALAAISSAFSGIGGGGGASSGVGGSGSVNNNSAVNTSFGGGLSSGNQRVVFQISGRNLLGVLQNEIGASNRINGQNIENISLG